MAPRTDAYVPPQTRRHYYSSRRSSFLPRQLLPLTSLSEDLSFLQDQSAKGRYPIATTTDDDDDDGMNFFVPQEEDLPDVSAFVVRAFGADAINLSTDFTQVEQFLLQPVAGLLNGYSGLAAYTEVLAGLRQRCKARLVAPSVQAPDLVGLDQPAQIQQAAAGALLLVLAVPNNAAAAEHDIVAAVELRLELTDGKIPFSLPWLDRAERGLASFLGIGSNNNNNNVDLQPYLSTLCVDENYRNRGLGRALVHCCEDVARVCWKRDRLYLHVDPDNTAAVQLYLSEGYQEVKGVRWNPFWAGPAAEIGYFVKELC